MKKYYLIVLLGVLTISIKAQNDGSIGLGTSNPDSSAVVDIYSNTKGILIPRLDSNTIMAIPSAANGLICYNTQDQCFWYHRVTDWERICNTDSLHVNYISSDTAIFNNAYIDSLISNFIQSDTLIAQYIQTTIIYGDTANFNYAYIDSLISNYIHSDTIIANYIQTNLIYGDSGIFNYLNTDTIIANYIETNFIYGDSAIFNYLSADTFYLHGQNLDTLLYNKWDLNGNIVTDGNFLGTLNNKDLIFKTNNQERIRINQNRLLFHSGNILIGQSSGMNISTGVENIFLGNMAGMMTSSGWGNNIIGYFTGYSNSTGNSNNFIGPYVGYSNSTGNENNFIGYRTGYYNTTGSDNIFIGSQAGYSNTEGSRNIFIGIASGSQNTIDSNNICIGNYAGVQGKENILIGNNIASLYNHSIGIDISPLNDYEVRIGSTSITWIGGKVGWSTYSDKRFKENINKNIPGLKFITKLQPVTYTWNIDKLNQYMGVINPQKTENQNRIVYSGFLAQDVEKVAKEIGYNFSGVQIPKNSHTPYSIRYTDFIPPLVKAIQEMQKEIEDLQKENQELKNKLENK